MSDAEALDKIAQAVRPFDGEWSDMPSIIERVSDIVVSTGRTIGDDGDDLPDESNDCGKCRGAGTLRGGDQCDECEGSGVL